MNTATVKNNFNIKPIGYVQAARDVVDVIFCFDRVEEVKIAKSARHPRNHKDWHRASIFAQRGKKCPNLLGRATCRVVAVEGVKLTVMELDALDRAPVVEIKPVMSEFLPRTKLEQPEWSRLSMSDYRKYENAGE